MIRASSPDVCQDKLQTDVLINLRPVQGHTPPVQVALDLFNILNESDINLRQPVALEKQLLGQRMDSDVGKSMLQLLQVCLYHTCITTWLASSKAEVKPK